MTSVNKRARYIANKLLAAVDTFRYPHLSGYLTSEEQSQLLDHKYRMKILPERILDDICELGIVPKEISKEMIIAEYNKLQQKFDALNSSER